MDLFTSTPAAASAEKALTVTQLTRRVKDVLERQIGALWVTGEISNHRLQSSGHHYFTLKDAGAQLSCVLFKGSAQFVRTPLADGLMVQVYGEITVYEARGHYQMLVKKVQAAGQGALQMRFEELKRRLAAEGLFAAEHKQEIPRLPRTVAIVTSPTGAALQDMLNILQRRAPWLRILITPVRVQGAGAEHEIAAALQLLSEESGHGLPHIDTVVVARGGGSLEDLWCFNEEVVARAIFACPLPVISAVGHEIDFTIADFVADLRAPTPSAAAELLAPDHADLLAALEQQQRRMTRCAQQAVERASRIVDLMSRGPLQQDAERLLLPWRQRLDGAGEELESLAFSDLQHRTALVQSLQHRLELQRPDRRLAERVATLEMLHERLTARVATALERRRAALENQASLLRTLGPEATLERGFTCTLDAQGRVIREASQLQPGDEFETRFRRGRVRGTVKEVRA
jgi:exodeoxyribonuclease VII large subunit